MTGDLYAFKASWPITDDTLTLRELVTEGIDDLKNVLAAKQARLTEPPVWTVRIAKGCVPRLHAEAPAVPRSLPFVREPAACGTDSGHKRHRRLGEIPCGLCMAAHAAAERARYAKRPKKVAS